MTPFVDGSTVITAAWLNEINDNFPELLTKANLLNFDESGNLIANVTMRTGLYASLISLAGSLGEIGVCTDMDVIILFSGVAGTAQAFKRNRCFRKTQLNITTVSLPTGAGDTRLVFNTGSRIGDIFTVAGGYGSLPVLTADNIVVSGLLRLAYVASVTSLTLTIYSEDAVGAGTYSPAGSYVYPVFMVSGVGAVVPFELQIKPAVDFADSSVGIRWYIAAHHNGSASCSLSVDGAGRGILVESWLP